MLKFNKIIAGFNKTITKLEKLGDELDIQERLKTARIKELKADCQAHEDERKACWSVADKLRELIEPKE